MLSNNKQAQPLLWLQSALCY